MRSALPREESLTAHQLVLLAADDLQQTGALDFTEWQLSVAAWKRNFERFGMRGFEKKYPDHKRVMTEIDRNGTNNPLRRGYLERVRRNCYRLTDLGRAEASRLRSLALGRPQTLRSQSDLYDNVSTFANHRVFQAWLDNREEPKSWLGASAFLDLARQDGSELESRLAEVVRYSNDALAWCEANRVTALRRGAVGGGRRISRHELQKLQEFVALLQTRFAPQMAAVRLRKRRARASTRASRV